ncbi:hypothetical protein VKT23_018382 [Stygiomarasmius scandens]|uniref:PPM-type phosphatase domain-containing protein n=1 Tax=Marasmiellus scandens TaxID=2682957 RepID=A0ABR1IPK5_9AGAR
MSLTEPDEVRKETDMGKPGSGPWPYTVLPEPKLSSELARLAGARIIGNAHCVSFQPNGIPEYWNQDRYVVRDISMPVGESWKLRAVFDGHLGHELVDYTASNLPVLIQSALESHLSSSKSDLQRNSEEISSLLKQCIVSFDESILGDLASFFPHARSGGISDEDIKEIVNNVSGSTSCVSGSTSTNYARILRSLQGATALIVLINPESDELWVANLGDCQAVLGVQNSSGEWDAVSISTSHDCWDDEEVDRLKKEHPGESEVVLRHRVLGAMAVTRALGDYHYKLSRIYTDRVFLNIEPSVWPSEDHEWIRSVMQRNLTPPYLSNSPDVRYLNLNSSRPISNTAADVSNTGSLSRPKACLMMCSDGLVNLYDGELDWDPENMFEHWIRVVASESSSSEDQMLKASGIKSNHALRLLRDALGGRDEEKVSSMMTVEMEERWMDDTTVIVEFF